MKRPIGSDRSLEMITDLADAALDIRGLTLKYGVDREDLARWMLTQKTQRILAGLCMLTDFQTQLLINHYRVTAVSRLVEMMQQPREKVDDAGNRLPDAQQPPPPDPELVRKACVDLLRLNMDGIESTPTAGETKPVTMPRDVIRNLLYGDLIKPPGSPQRAPVTTDAKTQT